MIRMADYYEFTREYESKQEKVKKLLERFPECRESYGTLVNYYWHYCEGLHRFIPKEKLRQLTSPETITRAFRKVIADNPSLAPTPKTRRERDVHLDRMRRYHGEEAKRRRLML